MELSGRSIELVMHLGATIVNLSYANTCNNISDLVISKD